MRTSRNKVLLQISEYMEADQEEVFDFPKPTPAPSLADTILSSHHGLSAKYSSSTDKNGLRKNITDAKPQVLTLVPLSVVFRDKM